MRSASRMTVKMPVTVKCQARRTQQPSVMVGVRKWASFSSLVTPEEG